MRFLIVDAEYPEFLHRIYSQNPSLRGKTYAEQMQFRNDKLFGMADFYSSNLNRQGHQAFDIWVNNEALQRTWATEHGLRVPPSRRWRFRLRRGLVPWVSRITDRDWLYLVLAEQIKHYRPDVLVNMVMGFLSARFLEEMKPYIRLTVGWGSPPVFSYKQDPRAYTRAYDLVLAVSEGMVGRFRAFGLRAELLRHAFEPRVLSSISVDRERTVPVSFVGLLRGAYFKRRELLEALCSSLGEEISIWASSIEHLPADSQIRRCYQGHAWGEEFYQILSISKIAWNNHIDIAGDYADNLRLFEATGMRALLVTDWKEDLPKIFELDREIVAYKNVDECVELTRYYLENEGARHDVALAGQRRTLREHTYWHRAQELADIVRRCT